MAAANVRVPAARDGISGVVFWQHHARDVDLAAANVSMDIDRASHHHTPTDVGHNVGLSAVHWRADDFSVTDVQVANVAVHSVLRIVNSSAFESLQH